jgi:hypothetical protein
MLCAVFRAPFGSINHEFSMMHFEEAIAWVLR